MMVPNMEQPVVNKVFREDIKHGLRLKGETWEFTGIKNGKKQEKEKCRNFQRKSEGMSYIITHGKISLYEEELSIVSEIGKRLI